MAWKEIGNRQDAIKFWQAGAVGLFDRKNSICPLCEKQSVRFYAHHFSSDSSAIWSWCQHCKLWTVASNMKLWGEFDDPFSNAEISQYECLQQPSWIDRLDELWEAGTLPQYGRRIHKPV
ncbi:hypothetical protein AB1L30_27395 [Bremerella sp. JC817]|uniref:hypothetical protein n=1 Tax=Bremerella sp. JC817 TaxID=3231756 RepID=UPI003458E53F